MRRTALITGGDRGIGRACSIRLAEDGWSVILLCREREDLAAALTEELRTRGLDADWRRCDVSDPASVREAFAGIEASWHHIDALVCSAGRSLIRLLTDTDEEAWRSVTETDLSGVYRCIRAAAPGMISRRQGTIVTVSSMWGEVGASCESAYSAAKAGVIGLTRALAKELGPSGIRVNCVSPGVIDTDMNRELGEETLRELAAETPLGRIGTPGDVAEAVAFLVSDRASFITGQVLGVNGGFIV